MTLHPARFGVVQRLQGRLAAATSAYEYALYDHAIDLTLDADGKDDEHPAFIFRNAIRDARRTVGRRQRSALITAAPDLESLESGEAAEHALREAEALEAGHEALLRIEDHLDRTNPDAARWLRSLWNGESIEEAAEATGLPERRVRYLRSRALHLARSISTTSN